MQKEEIFKKLHISNILELALLAPSSYEDLSLKSLAVIGHMQLIDATIKSVQKTSKYLKLSLYSHNLN